MDKAIRICRASESALTNSAALRAAAVHPVSSYRRSRSTRRAAPVVESGRRRRSGSDSGSGRDSRSPVTWDRGSGRPGRASQLS